VTQKLKPLMIDLRQKGSSEKLLSQQALLTSHQAGWDNIHLVYHHLPYAEVPESCHPTHTIALGLGATVRRERWVDDCYHSEMLHRGSVAILPAGVTHRANVSQPLEFMLVGIEPKFFTKVAQEWCNPDCTQLIPRFADQQDSLLLQLGLTLKAELEQGCLSGKLYIDSISQLLTVHLLKTYSNNRPLIKSYSNPLPNRTLQSVIDYIQANLDREIPLTQLAQIARVNHYYFCTLFKKSTGLSPHRYILQQRIERAKKLLKNSQNTIVDIAFQCGFANQSHFTKRFHELTGLTPKVYRNQV
jgi:AraC family transcriptional regulator